MWCKTNHHQRCASLSMLETVFSETVNHCCLNGSILLIYTNWIFQISLVQQTSTHAEFCCSWLLSQLNVAFNFFWVRTKMFLNHVVFLILVQQYTFCWHQIYIGVICLRRKSNFPSLNIFFKSLQRGVDFEWLFLTIKLYTIKSLHF